MALYHRFKRQFFSRVYLVRVVLVVIAIVSIWLSWFWVISPLSRRIYSFSRSLSTPLSHYQGRTNFLLLGVGGGNHEGADLTDTIILVSVDQASGDVGMISIPRDLWIPSLRSKINAAYHYGEEKLPGSGGFTLIKSAVHEAIGQPVHYVAMINFANFEQFIDSVGGVDITVDTAFDDYEFPIPGREDDLCDGDPKALCRYEHLHFNAGPQHMSGNIALKFIRSRHAVGDEGTDFARSKRQEKLIAALKSKLTSSDVITHPDRIKAIYASGLGSITTDIHSDLFPAILKLGLKSYKSKLRATSISDDLVYNPPLSAKQDFQWVLVPKGDSFQTLELYVKNFLTTPVQK